MLSINVGEHKGFTSFTVKDDILDLVKTFECGQCFRWKQNDNGSYSGVVNGEYIIIGKAAQKDQLTPGYTMYLTNISKDNIDWLFNYLDLHTDYTPLETIELTEFEKRAVSNGKGIRILKQDKWESLVSFIISQRNNIPKIKTTIEKLCMKLGTKKEYIDNRFGKPIIYYTFPTPEQIVAGGMETLDSCGLGYRSEYVYNAAKSYNTEISTLENLEKSNAHGNEVVEYLMTYRGVGPKVANCVALFGFHKLDMFPIDIWMSRAIDTYYNGSINIDKFGSLAGLMQQYIFFQMKTEN